MRDSLLIVVLLAGVVGAVGFLWPRFSVQARLGSPSVVATSSPTPKAIAKPVLAKSVLKHSNSAAKEIASLAPENTTVVNVPDVVEIRPPAENHRAISELKEGLNRTDVVRMFGGPDLKTANLNKGALLEKYIYVQKAEGRSIVATLKDGEVQNVWTLKTPADLNLR
jgi:hypothetical protein